MIRNAWNELTRDSRTSGPAHRLPTTTLTDVCSYASGT